MSIRMKFQQDGEWHEVSGNYGEGINKNFAVTKVEKNEYRYRCILRQQLHSSFV